MITAGIDVGAQTVKVVILKDGQVLSRSLVYAGFDISQAADQALAEALEKARLSAEDLERIMATGAGRKEVHFANEVVTEITSDARGAVSLFPSVRTVVDVGAE